MRIKNYNFHPAHDYRVSCECGFKFYARNIPSVQKEGSKHLGRCEQNLNLVQIVREVDLGMGFELDPDFEAIQMSRIEESLPTANS